MQSLSDLHGFARVPLLVYTCSETVTRMHREWNWILCVVIVGLCLIPAGRAAEGKPAPCDNTEKGDDCTCLKALWPCSAGKYCPEQGQSFDCPKGYYCPQHSAEPTICCAGYYCPSPSEIKRCKSGHFCKKGQVEPFKCGWTERCPEGTSEPQEIGMYGLLTVVSVLLAAASSCKDKYYHQKTEARKERQKRLMKEWKRKTSEVSNDAQENLNPLTPGVFSNNNQTGGIEMKSFQAGGAEVAKQIPAKKVRGYSIRFENLGVSLPDGNKILSGVSGALEPGRTTAVMGPSGAGKSTFINVLSNKVERSEGRIEVDGKFRPDGLAQYRTVFGFVPQEDVMLRQFSPYYNITFSAKYRLPNNISNTKRREKVTKTLKALGLLHVQNEVIGDERQRGISGGQRKRVNIGLELVNDCGILFLDEPTSGLDSSSAMDICQTLRKTAEDEGITIAAILHQPRYEIFNTFNDLLLLGEGGRTIYSGPTDGILKYLRSIGFHPPMYTNPADYISDVSSGRVYREGSEYFSPETESYFPAKLLPNIWKLHKENELTEDSIKKLEAKYKHSKSVPGISDWNTESDDEGSKLHRLVRKYYREYCSELNSQFRNFKDSFCRRKLRKTPGCLKMFMICFTRAFKGVVHSIGRFFAENMLHFFVGFFLGIIASENADVYIGPLSESMQEELCPFVLKGTCRNPLIDGFQQLGMFVSWGVSFAGAAVASNTFGPEETNYWREVSSGLYTLPYFLAKCAVDILRIGLAAAVFEVAFFAAYTSIIDVLRLYAIVVLLYFNGFQIGYFLTTLVGVRLSPLVALVVTLLSSAILSGFAIRLPQISSSWIWLFQMSYARWGIEAYYILSVEPYQYFDLQPGLDNFGYDMSEFDPSLKNMAVVGAGWCCLAFLLMVVRHLDKKR
eukprot:gb/GECG01007426.1/.p1 GENE.gb/GECG01007426.1/~~gb/GECG01007426.1/.p1  ORF type:complete len:903 (+),score=87.91 gb/GECG01007426.1/:1-2709(+)